MKAQHQPGKELTHETFGEVTVVSSNFRIAPRGGYVTTYTVDDAQGARHLQVAESALGKTKRKKLGRGKKEQSSANKAAHEAYTEIFAEEVPIAYKDDTKWIKAEVKAKQKSLDANDQSLKASQDLLAQTKKDYKEAVGEEAPEGMTMEAMQEGISTALNAQEDGE